MPPQPLSWLNSAQNWFTKTERSSGFRPFLIFIILIIGLGLIIIFFADKHAEFAKWLIGISCAAFIALYYIKSISDPNFCRSEKHIEAIKKLELAEQKGDTDPVIDVYATSSTAAALSESINATPKQ